MWRIRLQKILHKLVTFDHSRSGLAQGVCRRPQRAGKGAAVRKIVVTLGILASAAMCAAATAAVEPDQLTIVPEASVVGESVWAKGACSVPGTHLVTSPGFVSAIPLNESGQVVNRPGAYTASLRCGQRTITARFEILPLPPVRWSLWPEVVAPGGEMIATTLSEAGGCTPRTGVTSPGLAAPIQFTAGGNFGKYEGYGHAGRRPGRYDATFTCYNGQHAHASFVITGTSQPSERPQSPGKTRPQIPVKPKGAPQTGDGSTAPGNAPVTE